LTRFWTQLYATNFLIPFRTPVSTSSPLAKYLTRFWTQLYATNFFSPKTGNISSGILFAFSPFPIKTAQKVLLVSSMLLKHGHHFGY
jgi:hypothetical protein